MKNTIKFFHFCSIFTLMTCAHSFAKDSEKVNVKLEELHNEVGGTKGAPLEKSIAAARFKQILPDVDFGPTEGARQNINMCSAIITPLILNVKNDSSHLSVQDREFVSALELLVAKIDKNIDPRWVFMSGSMNISPPPGTPNAIAGMNPDAISDPVLRKKYMDDIAAEAVKQLINKQQRELRDVRNRILLIAGAALSAKGWKTEELEKLLAPDEESKVLLERNMKLLNR